MPAIGFQHDSKAQWSSLFRCALITCGLRAFVGKVDEDILRQEFSDPRAASDHVMEALWDDELTYDNAVNERPMTIAQWSRIRKSKYRWLKRESDASFDAYKTHSLTTDRANRYADQPWDGIQNEDIDWTDQRTTRGRVIR